MSDFTFFVGLHQPSDAKRFDAVCISIERLLVRRKPIGAKRVFVDSGAFTKLDRFGRYPEGVEVYAAQLYRLWSEGVAEIEVVVAQDYMCEPFILAKTGLTVEEHQRLTVERYDALVAELTRLFDGPPPFHVLPVIQGFTPEEYVRHIRMYGDRLKPGMWVGVGSVCKRQGNVEAILSVLRAIKGERPDLRLHGFGVKLTALLSAAVRELLDTADSLAWSYSARKQGRNANDWQEAKNFTDRIAACFEPVAA